MATDPVCGMEVDPQHAAAQITYHGTAYYFCSIGCKEQFERSPASYLQRTAAGGMAHPSDEGSRPEDIEIDRGHGPAYTHGTDVIEGHGSETTTSGADVIERGEPGGLG
ncbi:MAG TPA: YHS domain-containing protein [Ktedonobacterales bacterium]|nr:YHS domain-containing protein [Ktedonobacterales bacterium]